MLAIAVEKPGQFCRLEVPEPFAHGPEEALVRVRRVGICGTDYHAFRGNQPFFTYPRVLGHELGVEIVAIDSNARGLVAGDLCAVEPYLNCGLCIACRNGKSNCCENLKCMGVHIDGGMREYINVPVSKLHCSKKLSIEHLALVEMLGVGAHAVNRAAIKRGDTVLVIGAGPIGLSVLQFAKIEGATIVVLDVNESRLKFCSDALDIKHTLLENQKPGDGANASTLDRIRAIFRGELPLTVFDATGNPESMARSINFVASGGKLVFVGLYQGNYTFSDPEFHRRELTLMASRNSTSSEFCRIIELMENGTINARPWITHRAHCDSMIQTFPSWLSPESNVIKAMVEF